MKIILKDLEKVLGNDFKGAKLNLIFNSFFFGHFQARKNGKKQTFQNDDLYDYEHCA